MIRDVATEENRSHYRQLAWLLARQVWSTHDGDPNIALAQLGAVVVHVKGLEPLARIWATDPPRVEVRKGLPQDVQVHALAHELGHLIATRVRLFAGSPDPMVEEWFAGRFADEWARLAGLDLQATLARIDAIMAADAARTPATTMKVATAVTTTTVGPKPRAARAKRAA